MATTAINQAKTGLKEYKQSKDIAIVSEPLGEYMTLEEFRVEAKTSLTKTLNEREYMTSEEFRRRATIKVNQFCDKHGIL